MSLQTRLSALITAIGTDIKELKGDQWGAWTALPYSANWGDFGGAQQVGQYRKTSNGKKVQLRGMIKVSAAITLGSTNSNPATLPAGSRPPAATFRMVRVDTTTTNTVLLLGIGSSGVFTLWSELTGRSLTYPSGTYLSLDGIEFSTEA